MSDDLDMKALSGEIGSLALDAQQAGCDVVLNCWAKMADMVDIAGKMAAPGPKTIARIERAERGLMAAASCVAIKDRQRALLAQRDALLAT